MSINTKSTFNQLQKLIKSGTPKDYLLFFKQFHEADIAENLSNLSADEREQFFKKVNPTLAAEILEELNVDQQIEIISKFKINVAAKYIEEMDPDDATDLLEELAETNQIRAQQIINALPKKEKSEIENLLSYPESSAGALMTSTVLTIPENLKIDEALKLIKQANPPESELSFYIFITSTTNTLVGYTTLRDLVFNKSNKNIYDLRHEHHIFVNHFDDQEVVANLFQKYDMSVIPVVDDNQHLLGAITVDDVVDVVIEEANEDIYKLTGTTADKKQDLLSPKISQAILSRLPWLIITIFGGILASVIINAYSQNFNPTLFPLALSLSFIPLLMGLGGNVGNQSSAIIVRAIAMRQVKQNSSLNIIAHELLVSLGIGILISASLFLISHIILHYSLLFSSIVSVALLANIIVAAIIGTALPLLFNKINIDPAVASAPFISTTLDIIGQLIYFSFTIYAINIVLT